MPPAYRIAIASESTRSLTNEQTAGNPEARDAASLPDGTAAAAGGVVVRSHHDGSAAESMAKEGRAWSSSGISSVRLT